MKFRREQLLVEAIERLLEYIDNIPAEAAEIISKKAMPGIDRDYLEDLLYNSLED